MTTHTTPIDLRPYHGRDVKAVIGDYMLTTEIGRFSVSKSGSVFFCNNSRGSGINPEDIEKFGYSRVWVVQCSTDRVWDSTQLKSITILDEPKSINHEWDWKDGEEVYLRGNKYKCHMLKDDLVCFASAATGVCRKLFTLKAAYNHGFRKLPPQPQRKLVEITEEVFRSTAWYGKKVIWADKERKIIAVDYETNNLHFGLNRQSHYSQCKLIEE